MAHQIKKRLICLWKGCDELVFEEAAAFKAHIDKHFHEQMQTDLDMNDGTEEQQQQDEPLAKKAKLNEEKMANGLDIGRRKIICIDVVVWTDVLGFIRCIQLAHTVSLTNLQIYAICWPRLHGNKVEAYQIWSHITIMSRERFDRGRPPKALVLKDNAKLMPMPSSPPPAYISGFSGITIKFLDQQVFAFFTHILPCLAESGVKLFLKFNGSDANQCVLLDQLLNLFRDGLPTDKLHAACSLADIQYLPDIDNKMQKICLYINKETGLRDIPILMKMLASPCPDGQQRVIHFHREDLTRRIIEAIKKDFHSATQPLASPFYICFDGRVPNMRNSAETNKQTGEHLTIMPPTGDDTRWEICRHPRGQHEQWAEDGRKRIGPRMNSSNTMIHVDLCSSEYGLFAGI